MGECHVTRASHPSLCVPTLDRHQSQRDYPQLDSSMTTKETIPMCCKDLKTTQPAKYTFSNDIPGKKIFKTYYEIIRTSVCEMKAVFFKVLYKLSSSTTLSQLHETGLNSFKCHCSNEGFYWRPAWLVKKCHQKISSRDLWYFLK